MRIPKITLNRKKSQQQIVKPDTDQRTENTNSPFHKYQSNTTKNSLLKIVQTYCTVTFDHFTEFKYIQSDNFLSLLNKLKTLQKVVRQASLHIPPHPIPQLPLRSRPPRLCQAVRGVWTEEPGLLSSPVKQVPGSGATQPQVRSFRANLYFLPTQAWGMAVRMGLGRRRNLTAGGGLLPLTESQQGENAVMPWDLAPPAARFC